MTGLPPDKLLSLRLTFRRAAVRDALDDLAPDRCVSAASPDDIAGALAECSCSGNPHGTDDCPLAFYLNHRLDFAVEVHIEEVTFKEGEYQLPPVFAAFLRRLGRGMYPELCETFRAECGKCGAERVFRFVPDPPHETGKWACSECGRTYRPKGRRKAVMA